jgi:aspartate kinase
MQSHYPTQLETIFEKRRGISRVEVRNGFAQVHVSQIEAHVMEARLQVLAAVADSGISVDFLKMTPTGMSFMIQEDEAARLEETLNGTGVRFTIRHDRSIVLVYAVNIRDEEGMIANIVQTTITTCARVDHVGDMHDRLLMVVKAEDVSRVVAQFETALRSGAELEVGQ